MAAIKTLNCISWDFKMSYYGVISSRSSLSMQEDLKSYFGSKPVSLMLNIMSDNTLSLTVGARANKRIISGNWSEQRMHVGTCVAFDFELGFLLLFVGFANEGIMPNLDEVNSRVAPATVSGKIFYKGLAIPVGDFYMDNPRRCKPINTQKK